MTYQPTPLEAEFDRLWKLLGGPRLEFQYRFAKPRRFRWDFAQPTCKVGIDLQGGIYQNGWHQSIKRYEEDCEKLNIASSLGWRSFHLTSGMLRRDPVGTVGAIIATIRTIEGDHGLSRLPGKEKDSSTQRGNRSRSRAG